MRECCPTRPRSIRASSFGRSMGQRAPRSPEQKVLSTNSSLSSTVTTRTSCACSAIGQATSLRPSTHDNKVLPKRRKQRWICSRIARRISGMESSHSHATVTTTPLRLEAGGGRRWVQRWICLGLCVRGGGPVCRGTHRDETREVRRGGVG